MSASYAAQALVDDPADRTPAALRSAAVAPHTLLEVALPGERGDAPVDGAVLRQWFHWLGSQGFSVDRCGFSPATGTIAIDVYDAERIAQLTDVGFTIIKQQTAGPLGGYLRTQSEYFDPGEIATRLAEIAAAYPDITNVFTIGTTYGGRDILAIEISDQPGTVQDEPAIQFNAQHHAREVATSHVVMDVVETLVAGYGVDTTITGWVDNYTTVCVPMVNTDGVQYVFDVDSFWRKNRQFYPPSCTGVDLNRNYAYRWGLDRCGFASSCSGSTYKGPSVASEDETQTMVALADAYHFVMATSYHSSGRFIDYPYACSTGDPNEMMPEHGVIHEMMNGVADAIDAVDSIPRYSVFSPSSAGALSGDDTSWYYAEKGAYPFIIEVGLSFEPAFSDVAGIVARNRGGWMYLYDRLGRARIDVHVTDACNSQPMEAEVTLTDFVFDTGELPRSSFLPFGRWTFVVEANDSYTVRASAPGYISQDVTVPVGSAPVPVDIALEPLTPCAGSGEIPAVSHWGMVVMLLLALTAGSAVFDPSTRRGKRSGRDSNPRCG